MAILAGPLLCNADRSCFLETALWKMDLNNCKMMDSEGQLRMKTVDFLSDLVSIKEPTLASYLPIDFAHAYYQANCGSPTCYVNFSHNKFIKKQKKLLSKYKLTLLSRRKIIPPNNNNPLKILRSYELNVRGKTKALEDRFFAVGRSQNQSLVFHRPLEEYGQRHLDCHQSKLQEKKSIA